MKLQFAKNLALPDDAATQCFGFVGRRGSGKTYGAMKLAELFLASGVQIIVIDPVGKAWSLRLAADGKARGFDVPVLGGHRGDLPLEPGAGALLADLVVDRRTSLVLDVSLMTQGELKRFARDFGERLLQRKKGEAQPTPLHLFVEEAQELLPERAQGDDERMKAAFVRLVKLGRNWGIGITLVTQRPQAVSKEALNQTECLVALQTVGAHERKALREWIAHHGEQEKLVDLLPALQSGEAYVWSPSWLGVLERVRIAARTTFDASATPTMASAKKVAAAAPLGAVDLEALRASMVEVVAKAEAHDPKALRAKVAKLEADLRKAQAGTPDTARLATERARGAQDATAHMQQDHRRELAQVVGSAEAGRRRAAGALDQALAQIKIAADALREPIEVPERREEVRSEPHLALRRETSRAAAHPRPERKTAVRAEGIDGPMQRVLDAIAWLEVAGLEPPYAREQVAFLARYKPGTGSFNNALGRLNGAGLVTYPGGGKVEMTDAGRAAAHRPDAVSGADELQSRVLKKCDGPMQRCLEPLLACFPRPMTRERLAEAARYEFGTGSFNNALGRLRTCGCIAYPDRGHVVARGWLFLEGDGR